MLMRSLSHFVVLAEQKHLARAARRCNVTRSTLTASIRELEEYCEAALIDRGDDSIGLTPHGEKALVWAKRILVEYENMQEDIRGCRSTVAARNRCEKR